MYKPSVDVDRLQLGGVAALVPEVAFPPRRPDGTYVVCPRCLRYKITFNDLNLLPDGADVVCQDVIIEIFSEIKKHFQRQNYSP